MATVKQWEILRDISREQALPYPELVNFYETFMDHVLEYLWNGDDVLFTRFALFEHVSTPERLVRNPSTGEQVITPAKTVIKVRRRSGLDKLTVRDPEHVQHRAGLHPDVLDRRERDRRRDRQTTVIKSRRQIERDRKHIEKELARIQREEERLQRLEAA